MCHLCLLSCVSLLHPSTCPWDHMSQGREGSLVQCNDTVVFCWPLQIRLQLLLVLKGRCVTELPLLSPVRICKWWGAVELAVPNSLDLLIHTSHKCRCSPSQFSSIQPHPDHMQFAVRAWQNITARFASWFSPCIGTLSRAKPPEEKSGCGEPPRSRDAGASQQLCALHLPPL